MRALTWRNCKFWQKIFINRIKYNQWRIKEELMVAPLRSMARRLNRTKFGQKALAQPHGLVFLKHKPTPRVYAGLALVAFSYLTGLPALALLSYLSVKMSEPVLIAVGGPVIFGLVHVIFGVGVCLAGRNYAMEAVLWAIKRFLEKYA